MKRQPGNYTSDKHASAASTQCKETAGSTMQPQQPLQTAFNASSLAETDVTL